MNVRAKISLVMLFLASCGTAALMTVYFQARADANVSPGDLYAVVNGQLKDIRERNFSAAYQYASSSIQRRFTVTQFADMVRLDYPGLMELTQTEYGAVQSRSGRAQVRVYFIDRNGLVLPCLYRLVREGEGWRIDGASLMQPWPPAVKMAGTML